MKNKAQPLTISIPLTLISQGRNRNCRFRLDFTMVSMSVMVIAPPSPQPSPVIAKVLSSSQPTSPAPTWEVAKKTDRRWLGSLGNKATPQSSLPVEMAREGKRIYDCIFKSQCHKNPWSSKERGTRPGNKGPGVKKMEEG